MLALSGLVPVELAVPRLDSIVAITPAAGTRTGRPSARVATSLRRPRNRSLELDVAGQIEVVGSNVTTFQPGDEVYGDRS